MYLGAKHINFRISIEFPEKLLLFPSLLLRLVVFCHRAKTKAEVSPLWPFYSVILSNISWTLNIRLLDPRESLSNSFSENCF